ncbi:MAG: hypothetical protein JW981_07190, partial [Anaerolineae bacterium]|nr:hypothetical protein [Anaerolineae bacterium]
MINLTNRSYAGEEDLQSMIDLLIAIRPPERISDFPSIVDLHEILALREVQDNTRLWFAGDRMVGFAFVDLYDNLRFEIDPQAVNPDIELEMVNWGVECIRRAMQERGESLTLDASCQADDAGQIAMLERHGFERQEIRSL